MGLYKVGPLLRKTYGCFRKETNKLLTTKGLVRSMVSLAGQKTLDETPCEVTKCDKDPTGQTKEDYLKFYSIEKKFVQNSLIDSIPKSYKELSKALADYTLMIRKPALQIINELESTSAAGLKKFILYGPQGSGKSLSLLHVMHYAALKDWVILYIPNGFRFVDSQSSTEVQHSQWRTGRVDQPKESLDWLSCFRQLNLNFLQKNYTTEEYQWGKRESTEKGSPLIDVIDQGIGRSLYASDAVGVILKEVRSIQSLNVMYAVDSFNGLFGKSSYKLDGKLVDVDNLSLVHHFNKLLSPHNSLANGAYVFALSQSGQYLNADVSNRSDFLILDDNALEQIGEHIDVAVSNYNQNEFSAIMNFYKSKNWITKDLSSNLLNEVKFLTGANPSDVVRYTSFL